MTTYNTGNPIGSTAVKDLYDNTENLDVLTNTQDVRSHPDRLGVERITWHGMEQRFIDLLAASGYEYIGDYAAGVVLTEYNQVIRDTSGEFWRVSGTTSLPYTTTGAGLPEGGVFVAVGDAALRQELDIAGGSSLVNLIWSGDKTWNQGNVVLRGTTIYVCKTNSHVSVTPPEDDPTNWERGSAANLDNTLFTSAATNATPYVVTSKLRERVSLQDVLGPDYVPSTANATDTTTAIQSLYDDGFKNIYLNYDLLYINTPLLFDPHTELYGKGKGGLNGPTKIIVTSAAGGISALQARDPSSGSNVGSKFTSLTINHADALAGSGDAAIDLTGCSHSIIRDISARGWTDCLRLGEVTGTSGGQYHDIFGAELANSFRGIRFNTAANSVRVVGGRIHSNLTGVYAAACNDIFIANVIENNELGMDIRSAVQGVNFVGRFEGNGKDLTTDALLPTKGACIIQSGATNNNIDAFCSGGADKIIDLDGRNSIRTSGAGYTNTANFATKNLSHNGSMQQDDDADGLANELSLSGSLPAGMTLSLDTVNKVTGDQSQLITVDATGTTRTDVVRVLTVTEGVPCTVSARVKTDFNAGWNCRVGRSSAGTEYGNVPIYETGGWAVVSKTFIPTSSLVYLTFYMNTTTAAGDQTAAANLWIDAISFAHGTTPPPLGEFERVISPRGGTRPSVVQKGEQFFDTTLGKPIWFKGPGWVDATGTAI